MTPLQIQQHQKWWVYSKLKTGQPIECGALRVIIRPVRDDLFEVSICVPAAQNVTHNPFERVSSQQPKTVKKMKENEQPKEEHVPFTATHEGVYEL